MNRSLILGIETSCDETAVGVVRGHDEILGHVILSQDVHQIWGGVVPELAARQHLRVLDDVVDKALRDSNCSLEDLDAIGVTRGPGLIGALLVGVAWAKSAAWGLGKPLVPVHHMEAHLFAPSLENPAAHPPFVALLVSGGHTLLLHVQEWGRYRLLGETRDDAAGEAFDKVAKLLGLPYPGGPEIQKLAREGDPTSHAFPRPMLKDTQAPEHAGHYDFSFSGLKTAVATRAAELHAEGTIDSELANLAASFQEAAVDVLASKTLRAVDNTGCRRVLIGGGVSANERLREVLADRLGTSGELLYASPRLSLDNGAMIARAAAFRLERGDVAGLEVSPEANLVLPGLTRG